MKEIYHVVWNFPPTTNRSGQTRGQFDKKHIIVLASDLFSRPTIITSDLHSHTHAVFALLHEYIDLSKFTVISAGDMAGVPKFGSNADPTPFYEYIIPLCGEFYFAQGNHDLPSADGKELTLNNTKGHFSNKTLCSLDVASTAKGRAYITSNIGKLAGVDGIMSGKNKDKKYKFSNRDYCDKVRKALGGKHTNILVTHDTPAIPQYYRNSNEKYIGNEYLYTIIDKYKPRVHIYGHCHHPTYHNLINGVNYICADARVLIFIPTNLKVDDLLHKSLEDEFIEYHGRYGDYLSEWYRKYSIS